MTHTDNAQAQSPHAAMAAWLALTAPGTLLTRGIVMLALIATPWLAPFVYVASNLRSAAAALLVTHLVSTLLMARRPGRWSVAVVFLGLLVVDALLCGVLLGVAPEVHGPAVPIAAAVLAMSFAAGGALALCFCVPAIAVGTAVGLLCDIATPPILARTLFFSTTLSVETSFAGVTAIVPAALSFPTALSVEGVFVGAPAASSAALPLPTLLTVETVFAGVPVIGSAAPLFMPALAIALIALCLGAGANLLRVRRAKAAVAASILAAARVAS